MGFRVQEMKRWARFQRAQWRHNEAENIELTWCGVGEDAGGLAAAPSLIFSCFSQGLDERFRKGERSNERRNKRWKMTWRCQCWVASVGVKRVGKEVNKVRCRSKYGRLFLLLELSRQQGIRGYWTAVVLTNLDSRWTLEYVDEGSESTPEYVDKGASVFTDRSAAT